MKLQKLFKIRAAVVLMICTLFGCQAFGAGVGLVGAGENFFFFMDRAEVLVNESVSLCVMAKSFDQGTIKYRILLGQFDATEEFRAKQAKQCHSVVLDTQGVYNAAFIVLGSQGEWLSSDVMRITVKEQVGFIYQMGPYIAGALVTMLAFILNTFVSKWVDQIKAKNYYNAMLLMLIGKLKSFSGDESRAREVSNDANKHILQLENDELRKCASYRALLMRSEEIRTQIEEYLDLRITYQGFVAQLTKIEHKMG